MLIHDRFIFNNAVSYDVNEVSIIEEKINLEIPDDIKVATNKLDIYNISYLKIINSESKDMFEQEVRNNQLWQKELKSEIKSLLPLDIQYESETNHCIDNPGMDAESVTFAFIKDNKPYLFSFMEYSY